MRKIIAGISIGVLMGIASPVLAGNAGDGSDWGTQPGYAVAISNTECADHGSFGAFGKDASLGIEKVHADWLHSYPGPGTDGTQTGINNSNLCGSPQN